MSRVDIAATALIAVVAAVWVLILLAAGAAL